MARSSPSHATTPGASMAAAPDRSLALSLIRCLRPGQWTKNLLVFAGLLFGHRLFDPEAVGRAVAAFAIFCALSGAVYLINDVADRESDRNHPLKARRPIAAGLVAVSTALTTAAVLIVGGIAASLLLGRAFALVAAAYVALQLLYSGPLKHIVIIDVLTLAVGFVLRAVAGAVAV